MRRCVLAVLLAALILPASASAASPRATHHASIPWRVYRNTRLGFAFRYPANWALNAGNPASKTGDQVAIEYPGRGNYSLTAEILPISATPSLSETLQRVIAYQRSVTHSALFAHIAWSRTSLGGRPAEAGVLRPSTEGGVPVSNGIYVTQWRSRVYQITIFSEHKPPFSRLSQFPSIYGRILATWRFI